MTYSEALERYLVARERLAKIDEGPQWPNTPKRRAQVVEDMRRAAADLDRLAGPCD